MLPVFRQNHSKLCGEHNKDVVSTRNDFDPAILKKFKKRAKARHESFKIELGLSEILLEQKVQRYFLPKQKVWEVCAKKKLAWDICVCCGGYFYLNLTCLSYLDSVLLHRVAVGLTLRVTWNLSLRQVTYCAARSRYELSLDMRRATNTIEAQPQNAKRQHHGLHQFGGGRPWYY